MILRILPIIFILLSFIALTLNAGEASYYTCFILAAIFQCGVMVSNEINHKDSN